MTPRERFPPLYPTFEEIFEKKIVIRNRFRIDSDGYRLNCTNGMCIISRLTASRNYINSRITVGIKHDT